MKNHLNLDLLTIDNEIITFRSPVDLKSLSSGVTGAGMGFYKDFVNRHVDKDYNCSDYKQEMKDFLHKRGFLPEQTLSMITAVKLENVHYKFIQKEAFSILVVVTAGVSNAIDASLGNIHPFAEEPGTINTWVFVNGELSDAAFVQSIITAVEAKTKALRTLEVKDMMFGSDATGTSTDSILIAATQTGAHLEFAGPVTPLGATIGESVYECTLKAITNSRNGIKK